MDRISAEVGKATKDPKIVEQLTKFGVDPVGNSPTEFTKMISADMQLWTEAVRMAGLQVK